MNGEWGEGRPFLSVNFSSPAAPCTTHNALIPTGMSVVVAGTTIAVAGMSIAVAGMTFAVVGTTIAVAGMSIAVVETAVPHPSLPEKDTIALWGKGKRPCCLRIAPEYKKSRRHSLDT